jgi:hypothetical protein
MQPPHQIHLDACVEVGVHEHVAVLYRGRASAFRLASFLSEGLARQELCIYLAPREFHTEMLDSLRALGTDVGNHLRSGALVLHEGLPDFSRLREWEGRVFHEAESRRAPMVRWLEESLWHEALGFSQENFFEFHALLNYRVKKYPSVALCQYDLEQVGTGNLLQAISVHRHLLVDGTLIRDNPFYVPAEKFIPLSPNERERDLLRLYRELDFDQENLLATLVGYSKLEAHPRKGS